MGLGQTPVCRHSTSWRYLRVGPSWHCLRVSASRCSCCHLVDRIHSEQGILRSLAEDTSITLLTWPADVSKPFGSAE
jgi:hypothetical protein